MSIEFNTFIQAIQTDLLAGLSTVNNSISSLAHTKNMKNDIQNVQKIATAEIRKALHALSQISPLSKYGLLKYGEEFVEGVENIGSTVEIDAKKVGSAVFEQLQSLPSNAKSLSETISENFENFIEDVKELPDTVETKATQIKKSIKDTFEDIIS